MERLGFFMWQSLIKPIQYGKHISWQALSALLNHSRGDTVKCLRNSASNAGQRVAVTAEGNCCANHVLKICTLQKCGSRFGHGLLAGLNMVILRSDLIAGAGKVISELGDDILLYFFLAAAVPRHEDGACRCLCAFDTLRMVMRHLCRQLCHAASLFQGVKQPACRRNTHGRAVAKAPIRLRVLFTQPVIKHTAVSGVGIPLAPLLHRCHQCGFDLIIALAERIHECLRYCDGHNGIIRKL